jgi:hypothetical protein
MTNDYSSYIGNFGIPDAGYAEGAVLNESGQVLFWELIGPAVLRLSGASNSCIRITGPTFMEDMTFGDGVFVGNWPEVADQLKLPKYEDLQSIDLRASTEETLLERRALLKMQGTTREAICEKIKHLLDQDHHDARYIGSSMDNQTVHLDLANRQAARRLHVFDVVGVMISKRQELFFWELYYDKYLFLQDAEGRMCCLSTKER